MDKDNIVELITNYAQKYEKILKETLTDHNEIERKLNEWIIDALSKSKEYNSEELEQYLQNNIMKDDFKILR